VRRAAKYHKNRMEKSLESSNSERGELEIDPLGVYRQLNKIIMLIFSFSLYKKLYTSKKLSSRIS